MTTCDLILDLSKPQGAVQRLFSRTGDDGSLTIRAHVRDGGRTVPADGKTARFKALRPDRSLVMANAETSTEDGTLCVSYTLSAHDASVPGLMGLCYFAIYESDVVESTESFAIVVETGAESGTSTDIRPYISIIDELMDETEAIGSAARNAVADAESAIAKAGEATSEANTAIATAEDAVSSANAAIATAEEATASANEAEALRVAAESDRASNESARAKAERGRTAAEDGRQEAEALRASKFAEMELRSKGWLRHYCTDGEYDAVTLVPIIENADDATIYFVPDPDADDANGWIEWIVDTSGDAPRWERMGTTNASVDYVTVDEIEAIAEGETKTGGGLLNLTGLSALWAKIKAKFAPKKHTHDASDITAGQLAAALIGAGVITEEMLADGAVSATKIAKGAVGEGALADDSVTSAKLDPTLRDSISRTPRATKESTGAYYAWIDIPIDGLTLRIGFHGARGLLILTKSGDQAWHQEYPTL